MNMQAGDIENDDDELIDQEEEDPNTAEHRGENQIASTSEISARNPIIINR